MRSGAVGVGAVGVGVVGGAGAGERPHPHSPNGLVENLFDLRSVVRLKWRSDSPRPNSSFFSVAFSPAGGPARTRGSASSMITCGDAADEKRKRVLEHAPRHRVGRHKCGLAGRSQEIDGRSVASNSARVAASKQLCNGQGRTTGVITVTKPRRVFCSEFCYA
jgi:hypothetical protein